MILSEFNIEYIDKKTIKGRAIANQLVDAPIIDDTPIISEFPYESILIVEHQRTW